jgi:RNA polymerase sigma factor (sigma-70 family)
VEGFVIPAAENLHICRPLRRNKIGKTLRLLSAAAAAPARRLLSVATLASLLQRLVRRRLGFVQPSDREDLVQDILLSIHAGRASYDPRRPFMPWLMSIAHHRMVDRARRHSRVWANEVLVDEFAESILDNVSTLPDSEYGDPEQVKQAVKSLPAGQRTAIELLKLRELSLKEAAHVSGMSVSALKVAAHRAIKALRGSLA